MTSTPYKFSSPYLSHRKKNICEVPRFSFYDRCKIKLSTKRTGPPDFETKSLVAISTQHKRKLERWTQCTKKGGNQDSKKTFTEIGFFSRKLISLRNIVLVTATINYSVIYLCHKLLSFCNKILKSKEMKNQLNRIFLFSLLPQSDEEFMVDQI